KIFGLAKARGYCSTLKLDPPLATEYVAGMLGAIRVRWRVEPPQTDDGADAEAETELSPSDQVIVSRWRDGRPVQEIAEFLNVSKKTVNNRIGRLRRRHPELIPHRHSPSGTGRGK